MNPKIHAVYFTINGAKYVFSGWWIFEWDKGDKIYSSKDEFLSDPIFGGKTIIELADSISEIDYDLDA